MRVRIALTTYAEQAQWGMWARRVALLPETYLRSVEQAGGCPVLLPATDPSAAADALRGVDGLVLSGGGDIDPGRYNAIVEPGTAGVQQHRDAWESALLEAAWLSGIPILGVCRGMQLMNVDRGGTLHQHLPDVVGNEIHRPTPGSYSTHKVRLKLASTVGRALGPELDVPTYHHQGICQLGAGLKAVGWAEDDTIEAIELVEHRFAVGVQWHPEESTDGTLFQAFVKATVVGGAVA